MAFDPSIISPDSEPALADVVAKMVGDLKTKAALPSLGGGLPPPSLAVVQMSERPLGVGQLRGNETQGPLPLISLKGGRLDAVARFELWAADAAGADAAVEQVQAKLLAARDELRALGFLKLDAAGVTSAERFPSGLGGSVWRKSASYGLLYEYHYRDTSGAESLIHRIPIHSDPEESPSPDRETTVVTGPTVRWDNEAAAALGLRGPDRVTRLALLAYVPGTVPSGNVVLRRSFDGAPGPPAVAATLAAFWTAAAAEAPVDVRFETSLNGFLAAFGPPRRHRHARRLGRRRCPRRLRAAPARAAGAARPAAIDRPPRDRLRARAFRSSGGRLSTGRTDVKPPGDNATSRTENIRRKEARKP